MSTAPKMSEADATKVKKLRADGEAAHKAGQHTESMKLLAKEKKHSVFESPAAGLLIRASKQ